MEYTLPNDVEIEKLSFDDIQKILDSLQIRYSARKDMTKEYLVQVLKRQLNKNSPDAPAILEKIRESGSKESKHLQSDHNSHSGDFDYLEKIKIGNMASITKMSQYSDPLYQDIRESEFTYAKSSDNKSTKKKYYPTTSSHKSPLTEAHPNEFVSKSQNEITWRGKELNRLRRFDQENLNKSFDLARGEEYDYLDQARNCYSDTQLLRGPIHVDYDSLYRQREEEFLRRIANQNCVSQNQESYYVEEVNTFLKPSPKLHFEQPIQSSPVKRDGNKTITIITNISIGVLFILFMWFFVRPTVQKLLIAQRTPIVFPSDLERN